MVLANDRETPASFRNAMVGSELQDVLTTQGKQVTRPGATKAQADIDIRDHDLGEEDFETDILEIGGTSGIAFAVASDQGRTFEIKVQIHDDDDNVRATIDSSDFDSLASARVRSVLPVYGDRVKFIITNTSGQPGNLISGSININIGTPEKVTANIQGGSITIEGANGAPFDEAALNAAIADDATSIVTYLSRALNSQGLDEFVSRVTDSTGSQIDPLTTAPLASVGSDSLLVDSNDPLDVSASTVPVEQQTPVAVEDSVGTTIDPATAALEDALKSNDTDEFVSRLAGADGVEIQEEALDTPVQNTDVSLVTYLARALNDVGQDELVNRLTDTSGAQINPDQSPEYPDNSVIEHDLDPNAQGDLTIGPVSVARSEAIMVAGNSIDAQNWSATVEWQDSNGNVFQTQTPTDLGLSGVQDESARPFRKGPEAVVIVTSDAAAGTQNRVNFYVDSHR